MWGVLVERMCKPDEADVAIGLDTAKTLLPVMSEALTEGPWHAGDDITLADLWAGAMFTLFDLAADGRVAIDSSPSDRRWLGTFKGRPSAIATRFSIEAAPT